MNFKNQKNKKDIFQTNVNLPPLLSQSSFKKYPKPIYITSPYMAPYPIPKSMHIKKKSPSKKTRSKTPPQIDTVLDNGEENFTSSPSNKKLKNLTPLKSRPQSTPIEITPIDITEKNNLQKNKKRSNSVKALRENDIAVIYKKNSTPEPKIRKHRTKSVVISHLKPINGVNPFIQQQMIGISSSLNKIYEQLDSKLTEHSLDSIAEEFRKIIIVQKLNNLPHYSDSSFCVLINIV